MSHTFDVLVLRLEDDTGENRRGLHDHLLFPLFFGPFSSPSHSYVFPQHVNGEKPLSDLAASSVLSHHI